MDEFIRFKRLIWFILPKASKVVKESLERKDVFGKKSGIIISDFKINSVNIALAYSFVSDNI